MKFTLSWLKDHLDTTAPLDEIVETLTRIGLEVEEVEDKAKALAPYTGRLGDFRRAASECRPPARLHGRYRRGHAGAGRVRRAERPHRHEGRLRAARHLHSGQEDHARRRHDPRRREPRHALLRGGARDLRRPRGHHRFAGPTLRWARLTQPMPGSTIRSSRSISRRTGPTAPRSTASPAISRPRGSASSRTTACSR